MTNNSWNNISKFFSENERLSSYYKEAHLECIEMNCQSSITIIKLTIEKLLDKIEELED